MHRLTLGLRVASGLRTRDGGGTGRGRRGMRPASRGREVALDDLYRKPGKAELVNGRIVRMPPASGLHGHAGAQIVVSLTAAGVGHAIGDNVGFIVNLPHRKSFCPDAAYHLGPLTMEFI